MVDRGLRVQRALRAGEYLTTQTDRYEWILATWRDRATTGPDAKAANIVLRALERLDKLLRLGDGEQAGAAAPIVIAANPEEYVRQLQQVVAACEQSARAGR